MMVGTPVLESLDSAVERKCQCMSLALHVEIASPGLS
jgi:hypothetical protein